jgi:hypothetical protein
MLPDGKIQSTFCVSDKSIKPEKTSRCYPFENTVRDASAAVKVCGLKIGFDLLISWVNVRKPSGEY